MLRPQIFPSNTFRVPYGGKKRGKKGGKSCIVRRERKPSFSLSLLLLFKEKEAACYFGGGRRKGSRQQASTTFLCTLAGRGIHEFKALLVKKGSRLRKEYQVKNSAFVLNVNVCWALIVTNLPQKRTR